MREGVKGTLGEGNIGLCNEGGIKGYLGRGEI